MTSKPVKRKTSSRKRHKHKPVKKVLHHCIQILPMLINCRLGKDTIFKKIQGLKQRGLNYKYDTLDAIHHLKSGGLIEEIEDENHRQRLLERLTTLGDRIAHLILWTNEYKKSHSRLLEAATQHLNIHINDFQEKALKSILRSRGWIDKEIEEFDEILYYKHAKHGIDMVMEYSGQILKDGLINRYINILGTFNTITYVARDITNSLIVDAVTYQMSVLLNIIEKKYYNYNIGVMDKWNLFEFVKDLNHSYPNFMFNQVRDMIVSDLYILGISKEEITEELKRLREGLNIKPVLPDPDVLAKLESYDYHPRYKNSKILIAAYTEYLRRLNSS